MKADKLIINDWHDLKHLKELMEEYGDSEYPFFGENENGENIIISIFKDRITVETFQHNGYCRVNHYHPDGTIEELYEH